MLKWLAFFCVVVFFFLWFNVDAAEKRAVYAGCVRSLVESFCWEHGFEYAQHETGSFRVYCFDNGTREEKTLIAPTELDAAVGECYKGS